MMPRPSLRDPYGEDKMTDKIDGEAEAIATLPIQGLRNAAKILGITAERDWNKEDFVRAIQAKQKEDSVTKVVFDGSTGPQPGFARILVHRDPTPGHKNSPIPIGFNGQIYQVPRGVEVDVPKEFIGVLTDARSVEVRQAEGASKEQPSGIYKEETQTSYPFQVLAVTPGKWKNPHDSRQASFAIRKEFKDMHGAWPTMGELRDFKKARMAKRMV